MNPHAQPSISLWALFKSFFSNRQLIGRMVRREVAGRYKGSVLGLGWSFVHPFLMLSVYTFVFSIAFRARWGVGQSVEGESKVMFAIVLFVGMIVHGVFSEILNRSSELVVGNINYVKKVVFPLEVLPVVIGGVAVFHAMVSLIVWLVAYTVLIGIPGWQAVLLPVVIFPLVILALGIAWALAALGAYLRDVGQVVSIVTTVLLFMAPVFYPIETLPANIQPLIMLNPLTFIIEQSRAVLIWGRIPDFSGLAQYFAFSLMVFWAGFAFFQKARKGFADVL